MRHEVERSNTSRLAALPGPSFTYNARDSGSAPPERRKTVLAGMVVPEKFVLKTGAQVMLVRNVDDRRGLVNGAVGRVLGFYHAYGSKAADGVVRDVAVGEDGLPILCNRSADGDGKENEKPLDTVKYEGTGKPPSAIKTEGSAKPVSSGKSQDKVSEEKYPMVEFLTGEGKLTVLVTRDEFRVEDNEGNVLARRVQVCPRFLVSAGGR